MRMPAKSAIVTFFERFVAVLRIRMGVDRNMMLSSKSKK
jgi:hypothetical protein